MLRKNDIIVLSVIECHGVQRGMIITTVLSVPVTACYGGIMQPTECVCEGMLWKNKVIVLSVTVEACYGRTK